MWDLWKTIARKSVRSYLQNWGEPSVDLSRNQCVVTLSCVVQEFRFKHARLLAHWLASMQPHPRLQKRIRGADDACVPRTCCAGSATTHACRQADESGRWWRQHREGREPPTGCRRRLISCRAPLRSAGTPAADSCSLDTLAASRSDRSALILYSSALVLSHLRASRLVADLEGFSSCKER